MRSRQLISWIAGAVVPAVLAGGRGQIPLGLLGALGGGGSELSVSGAHNCHNQPHPNTVEKVEASTVGYLSKWSSSVKNEFINDLRDNRAEEWIVVMGNEGGDLDSMVSALAWAYHLSHSSPQQKAVALLQTEEDALDLRPENEQALFAAGMAGKHKDLLTIDELPIKPWDLAHRIKGMTLVDHNVPRSLWINASVVAILDHHDDRGLFPKAEPRIIGKTASCATLIVAEILKQTGGVQQPLADYPRELIELLMKTIAIDSKGLKHSSSSDLDHTIAKELQVYSSWADRRTRSTMRTLYKGVAAAKSALEALTVRDLLRRDWKGDVLMTQSHHFPWIHLGFASIPVSLADQILRTPEGSPPEFFALERAWTDEIGADISVVLTTFVHPVSLVKTHEICLVVAHGLGQRLGTGSANRLFRRLVKAVEDENKEGGLLPSLRRWKRPDGKKLLERRMVWVHEEGGVGRKVVRPLMEKATVTWEG